MECALNNFPFIADNSLNLQIMIFGTKKYSRQVWGDFLYMATTWEFADTLQQNSEIQCTC